MELYQVTDIYLNAYLLSDGFECEDIKVKKETNRRMVVFCYKESDELIQAVKDYKENEFILSYVEKYLFTKRAITKALREDKYGK